MYSVIQVWIFLKNHLFRLPYCADKFNSWTPTPVISSPHFTVKTNHGCGPARLKTQSLNKQTKNVHFRVKKKILVYKELYMILQSEAPTLG